MSQIRSEVNEIETILQRDNCTVVVDEAARGIGNGAGRVPIVSPIWPAEGTVATIKV